MSDMRLQIIRHNNIIEIYKFNKTLGERKKGRNYFVNMLKTNY